METVTVNSNNLKNLFAIDDRFVCDFIRETLAIKNERGEREIIEINDGYYKEKRFRFEMSGYDGSNGSNVGSCTLENLAIINKFAFLGIYDYTEFLTIDFYKGCGTLYFKYWGDDNVLEMELGGEGTTEIILKIFKITIFSNKNKRRRA